VVLAASSEDEGGLGRVAAALALGLSRAGVKVAVALQRDGRIRRELAAQGLPVHLLPGLIDTLDRAPAGGSSLGAVLGNVAALGPTVRRLRAIAREQQADLFYSHGSWTNHLVAEATRGGGACGPGAVWHIHTAASRSNLMAARTMARRGDLRAILAVSRSALEPYAGFGPMAQAIHNGVELEACAKAAERPVLRERMGLDRHAFVFGYAGRLVAHKGVEVIARAALKLLARRPEAHFVLLGRSPAGGPDVLGEMKARFAEAGLAGRAHFPGYKDEPLPWIAGFDAALAASIFPDPCPLTVLEALALGVPVVGSRIGGIPELVEDGVDGVLLEPGDDEALAEALAGLAAQPDRRRAMARAARAAAVARFDSRRMIEAAGAALEAAAARAPALAAAQ
jgi:glycosyltransferase involved in cell wall biosynthesis